MIDLSNNNGSVDFKRLHGMGFRRVYLKRSQGVAFIDGKHDAYRQAALAAGLKVGEYHYAEPSKNSPHAEAEFFCSLLPKLRWPHALRPVLDLEEEPAQPMCAKWAASFIARVRKLSGHKIVLYSSPSYITACSFERPTGPLWLAAYGRNDGKEHPYIIPRPWKAAAAHQYTSVAKVAGVEGACDLSHVLTRGIDVHPWPIR